MRTLARYRHRGVLLPAGETFEVDTDAEARELVAIGFAARADVPAIEQPKPRTLGPQVADGYNRRDVRARRQ